MKAPRKIKSIAELLNVMHYHRIYKESIYTVEYKGLVTNIEWSTFEPPMKLCGTFKDTTVHIKTYRDCPNIGELYMVFNDLAEGPIGDSIRIALKKETLEEIYQWFMKYGKNIG